MLEAAIPMLEALPDWTDESIHDGLVNLAASAQADVYVTSDLKYNDFMTPDGAFVVADIGHFESEYCAIDILFDILSKNLFTFAVRKSVNSRNPIGYIVPSKQ